MTRCYFCEQCTAAPFHDFIHHSLPLLPLNSSSLVRLCVHGPIPGTAHTVCPITRTSAADIFISSVHEYHLRVVFVEGQGL